MDIWITANNSSIIDNRAYELYLSGPENFSYNRWGNYAHLHKAVKFKRIRDIKFDFWGQDTNECTVHFILKSDDTSKDLTFHYIPLEITTDDTFKNQIVINFDEQELKVKCHKDLVPPLDKKIQYMLQ